ncbi:MAG: SLC13 family permease [Candidatus Omnitrophica bacterium]|nr:SLC13 family permease [Candidatus Omnitrophota bacterium]MDD5042222.1 SLC13 family permease [Candidatus Omnitrophota bacterium]MDD5500077.1 SLC13 family permease [Candidatus Omnitrophota bacterium]
MKNLALKLCSLFFLSLWLGFYANSSGMSAHQALSISIFSASILGTLFFWDFRLSFAFIGTSILLMTKTIDLEHVIEFSSLEVILFLVGMMVVIGLLKDSGVFAWIVSIILRIPGLTGRKFVLIIGIVSALLACAIDEVTSIIFMVVAVLEICDYFEVNPVPFILVSVLSTNIGSSATVLGNPIGILIASKSGLSFEDFIVKAFPLAAICLLVTLFILLSWYRKPIKLLDEQMKKLGANDILIRLISVPPDKNLKVNLTIFASMLFFISLHRRMEMLWSLPANTVLLVVPLVASGLVMIWRHNKARKYIEKDVEWWTLLFFLLLFVQAGTLKYTGATVFIAKRLLFACGNSLDLLISAILWISAIGSSILDNVVLVAAFIPVVQGFQSLSINIQPLWWALLFGGCLGGNITLIGSTANIVAIGMLEKEKRIKINFLTWFWVGLSVGSVTTVIVMAALVFIPFYR